MPTEAALQAESKFFEISLELMCIANLDGFFVKLNPVWSETLGYSLDELYGHSFLEFIHPDDKQSTIDIMDELGNGGYVRNFINRYRLKSGGYIWLSWHASYDAQAELIYAIARDVTEQERMRASLAIIEQVTGVGVWEINKETEELYWSDKIHDIHETDASTYHPKLAEGINFYAPEAIPPLKEALEHLAETGDPYSLDLPFITARGNKISVNAKGFTEQKNGKVVRQYGTFEEVTEQLKQENEKKKLHERIDLSLRTSNIGIWELDFETSILYWDEQMHNLYDITLGEFSQSVDQWQNSIHPEDHEATIALFGKAMDDEAEFNTQFRIVTPNGKVKYIAVIASFTRQSDGTPIRATGVNWDITEQSLSRQALEEEKQRAEENEQKAQKAVLAKNRFLANVSHEIRTPMNGILGALQLLENKVTSAQAEQLLAQALVSTKGLIRVINDILDFSKIDAGEMALDKIETDLHDLLSAVCSEQKWSIKNAQVNLQLDYPTKIPKIWHCDAGRVKQVVTNIVSNALKFTRQGEVNISLKSGIEYNNKSCLSIEVQDTGIGIKPEAVNQLFEPFTQEDSTTTREYGGTGLGLSISRMLAQQMGGNVEVVSEINKGSTFTIYLPLKGVIKKASKTSKKEIEQPKFADLNGLRVLVAEDNEINLQVLNAMLMPTQADIETVKDGKALLDAYHKNKPDLVLTDIQMPVMDGVEACTAIREVDNKTPIIAVTANVMPADTEKYNQSGFNDCIAKPILVADLYETIEKVLKAAK